MGLNSDMKRVRSRFLKSFKSKTRQRKVFLIANAQVEQKDACVTLAKAELAEIEVISHTGDT